MITIIPMAGLGTRFKDFDLPKILVPVDNKPMFIKSASCLPPKSEQYIFHNKNRCFKRTIFVTLDEYRKKYMDIGYHIQYNYAIGTYDIITLKERTSGQASTVFEALEKLIISQDEGLLIFNCDSYFIHTKLLDEIYNSIEEGYHGYLSYFIDPLKDKKWSYITKDENDKISEIKEKESVSQFATTGLYFFNSIKIFKEYYDRVPSLGEKYISKIYSEMLRDGLKIKCGKVDKFYCFGTPKDLEDYNNGKVYN